MPFMIWGSRLVAVATGYALNDVTSFFSQGNEQVSKAVSGTLLVTAFMAFALLIYLFIFKK